MHPSDLIFFSPLPLRTAESVHLRWNPELVRWIAILVALQVAQHGRACVPVGRAAQAETIDEDAGGPIHPGFGRPQPPVQWGRRVRRSVLPQAVANETGP